MGILIQSTPALSNDICFTETVAKKLLIDVEFQKKTIDHQTQVIDVIQKQNINLFKLSDDYKLKIEGLQKDKEIQSNRANSLETLYKNTSKDLEDCKQSKPSRFTWFGIGFITAIIVGSVTAFAISK